MTPFEGLRVVDLSDRLSGAFAARLFGDFGADVILAEAPEGHALRLEPPFLSDQPGVNRGVLHAYANWNKRSVIITEEKALIDLVGSADVVVTTSDPVSSITASIPADAVHLSVTPHGLASSLTGIPGNNLTTSARTGWSYINAYCDEPPLQLPGHQVGYTGGVTGYIAAAAALRRRDHGDTAELVDVSELEAFALTVHPWAIGHIYAGMGRSNGAAGQRPRGTLGPLWDLGDGRMNFGIADFHHWPEAMATLGAPEMGEIEELIPDIGRHGSDFSVVNDALAESLPKLQRWPVFHQLAKLRCVSGVMQNIDDLLVNEQLQAREFIVATKIENQTVRASGAPAKLSPTPWQLHRPAPHLGEHDGESQSRVAREPMTTRQTESSLAAGPLAGLRVLSFGQAWAGTYASELLGLLGADVVQVGSLHRPDVFRRLTSDVPAGVRDPHRKQHPLNTHGHYNSVNLNKREVTLDLRQDKGRDLLWQLIPQFDMMVDNFRPTVMPSWGITLEKLQGLRPGMIWASVSGYGETGPYWDYPANGATTEPMSGFSSLHGYEGDSGMNTGGLFPDPISGYFLVGTIMAALAQRDKTGEAQRVDLSMMEVMATMVGDAVVEYDATGRLPVPQGNHHPRISPHNNYAAANDEWLALAVETDAAWQALVKYIGDPRLDDARFATMALRKTHEATLDDIIGRWCVAQDAHQAEKMLGALGIAAAQVKTLYELYSLPDPDLTSSGFVSQIDHPEVGPTWLPGRPWRYSAALGAPIKHAPCVGQHSREILCDELGISAAEYEALVAAEVTGTLDDL